MSVKIDSMKKGLIYITNTYVGNLESRLQALLDSAIYKTVVSSMKNQATDVGISLEIDSPWESFITPGPAIISLLGQLMVVSSKTDFSLTENTPRDGFKHIRQPKSFRATLIQVSNDGWGAFMYAHKNMDQIQLYMQQIPEHVKSALKIILEASPDLVKSLLPIKLGKIQDIGEQCVLLSGQTEQKFNEVQQLLGEILESTQVTAKIFDDKYTKAKIELNISAIQEQHLAQIGDNLKKRQSEIDVQVTKYQAAYDKAMKEIPTGYAAIAQDFVRSMVNLVNVLPGLIPSIIPSLLPGGGVLTAISGGLNILGTQNNGTNFQTANLLGIMSQFSDQIAKLKDGTVKVFDGTNPNSVQNPAGMFQSFGVGFGFVEGLLNETAGQSGAKSVQMIQRAKQVCTRLQDLYKNVLNMNISEDVKNGILKEVDSLYESSQPMAAAGAYASNGMTMQSSDEKVTASAFSGKYGNERFKAYTNLELLRDAQKRSDKVFDDMLQFQKEMKNLMTKMAGLDMEKVSLAEIVQLIKDGIIILAQIKQQWGKLIEFFAFVSSRAKVALQETLTQFIKVSQSADDATGTSGLSDKARQFFKGMLQKEAVDIHIVAYFLFTLSKTYVDISSRFLLDRLGGLAKMLTASDESERNAMMHQLTTENDNAQNEIQKIAGERRRTYKRLVEQRIKDVNNYVQQLGGPSKKDEKAARKGIEAMKAVENNKSMDLDSLIYG